MRQRIKKIVLVQQTLPYPPACSQFIDMHDPLIPMRVCADYHDKATPLAEIFYEAVVSEPLHPHAISQPSFCLQGNAQPVKGKINHILQTNTKIKNSWSFEDRQPCKLYTKPIGKAKVKEVESKSKQMDRDSQGLLSWRSETFQHLKQSFRRQIQPKRNLSHRSNLQKQNLNILKTPSRTSNTFSKTNSSKKSSSSSKIKQIKYNVISARKKMI